MFERLISFIPLCIIKIMVSAKRTLNHNESKAQDAFLRRINSIKNYIIMDRTSKPFIIAMVGLVGSGKSSVAHELAIATKATVIENDAIRIDLRKEGEGGDRAWAIAENVAAEVVRLGGNVILDSDFVDPRKRASLRERAKGLRAKVVFIRTYCDLDVASKRIRENDPGEFFNSAESLSDALDKGKDVKMRELIRRMPLHYRWINQGIGKWALKKLPFSTFAEIDTTNEVLWKREVEKCAKRLLSE